MLHGGAALDTKKVLEHNDKRRASIRQAAECRFCRILTVYSQTNTI
jgi:hypothetical protein